MTLEELLRELIVVRETDPQAATWQDTARLLLFLASDEAATLPPLLMKFALRGAMAELEATAAPAQDVDNLCDELTEHGKACIRRGQLLRYLARTMQALQQGAG
jgi:uncharacterized coiled-coil protein SlyX